MWEAHAKRKLDAIMQNNYPKFWKNTNKNEEKYAFFGKVPITHSVVPIKDDQKETPPSTIEVEFAHYSEGAILGISFKVRVERNNPKYISHRYINFRLLSEHINPNMYDAVQIRSNKEEIDAWEEQNTDKEAEMQRDCSVDFEEFLHNCDKGIIEAAKYDEEIEFYFTSITEERVIYILQTLTNAQFFKGSPRYPKDISNFPKNIDTMEHFGIELQRNTSAQNPNYKGSIATLNIIHKILCTAESLGIAIDCIPYGQGNFSNGYIAGFAEEEPTIDLILTNGVNEVLIECKSYRITQATFNGQGMKRYKKGYYKQAKEQGKKAYIISCLQKNEEKALECICIYDGEKECFNGVGLEEIILATKGEKESG